MLLEKGGGVKTTFISFDTHIDILSPYSFLNHGNYLKQFDFNGNKIQFIHLGTEAGKDVISKAEKKGIYVIPRNELVDKDRSISKVIKKIIEFSPQVIHFDIDCDVFSSKLFESVCFPPKKGVNPKIVEDIIRKITKNIDVKYNFSISEFNNKRIEDLRLLIEFINGITKE